MNQQDIATYETVNIVTIDELQLPRLDFLKIDVEGMEIEVLQDARASIEKFRPWCWVEYWKVDKDLLKEQFDGLGYSLFTMDE